MEEKALQIIETIDENGNKVNLKLYDMVIVDDQEYALLLPEDADEEADDAEFVLMRLRQDGDEYVFETIDDEDEFDLVSQAIIDDSDAPSGDELE